MNWLRHRYVTIGAAGSLLMVLAVAGVHGQSSEKAVPDASVPPTATVPPDPVRADAPQPVPAAPTTPAPTGSLVEKALAPSETPSLVEKGKVQDDPPEETPVLGPDKDKIDLHVKEADLSAVLKLLADQHKLNIVAGKDVTGKVTADLYGVSVDQALKSVLQMNGYDYRREDNFIYVYTKQQLKEFQDSQLKMETRVFPLNYINVTDAQAMVKPVLSKSAIIAASTPSGKGIPSGATDVEGLSYPLQDTLVITDYPDKLKEVARLIKELDVRPKQVLIEATILQVTLDDDTSLGVDFNLLAGIDFRELSTATFPVANPNSVIGAATPTGIAEQMPWGRVGTTGFATPGTGFQMGVITNDVSLFVQALEEVEDVNILSNPKLLALNKHPAEILVGERLGYRTTTTTATSEVENIEFLDTGTSLRFRPFISDDGYVRMEIHPQVSTGQISGLGLPSERTTEVTCNIMVRDGHTIVIGGLFDENSQIDKSQVPGLGNLPLVGALFRNDHQSTTRREIIVLLTPHIIDEGQAKAEGEQTLEYIERTVTGLRSRFPLYTREKLTQVHLGEAEKYYNRYLNTGGDGDRAAAMWNLMLTRHVAPNNKEVIRLMDKLDADQEARRPRLTVESILWKRMRQHGMFENLSPAPGSTAVTEPKSEPTPATEGGK